MGFLGGLWKFSLYPCGRKSVCPPRTVFLIMVRWEILNNLLGSFFSFWRLPPHNLLSFFSNGDIPKLKQLLQITEGWLKVDGPEKSNLEEAKIGHILDRMMIA